MVAGTHGKEDEASANNDQEGGNLKGFKIKLNRSSQSHLRHSGHILDSRCPFDVPTVDCGQKACKVSHLKLMVLVDWKVKANNKVKKRM